MPARATLALVLAAAHAARPAAAAGQGSAPSSLPWSPLRHRAAEEDGPLLSSSFFGVNEHCRPAFGFGRTALSNNIAVARYYWDVVDAYVAELRAPPSVVNIVELGAGLGGFAHLMVRELLRRRPGASAPAFRYIITDHREAKLRAVMGHPKLRALSVEAPAVLDYAVLDLAEPGAGRLSLLLQGAELDASEPAVVIAHSVTDDLPLEFVKLDVRLNVTHDAHVRLRVGKPVHGKDQCFHLFNVQQRGMVDVSFHWVRSETSRLWELSRMLPPEQLRSGIVQVPTAAMAAFSALVRRFTRMLCLTYYDAEGEGPEFRSRSVEERINWNHKTMNAVAVNAPALTAHLAREGAEVLAHERLMWAEAEAGPCFLAFATGRPRRKRLGALLGQARRAFDANGAGIADLAAVLPPEALRLPDDVLRGALLPKMFPPRSTGPQTVMFYENSHAQFMRVPLPAVMTAIIDVLLREPSAAVVELAEWFCNWTFPIDAKHRCEPLLAAAVASVAAQCAAEWRPLLAARAAVLQRRAEALWGAEAESRECVPEFWRSTECTICSALEPSTEAQERRRKSRFRNARREHVWLARRRGGQEEVIAVVPAMSSRVVQVIPGDVFQFRNMSPSRQALAEEIVVRRKPKDEYSLLSGRSASTQIEL